VAGAGNLRYGFLNRDVENCWLSSGLMAITSPSIGGFKRSHASVRDCGSRTDTPPCDRWFVDSSLFKVARCRLYVYPAGTARSVMDVPRLKPRYARGRPQFVSAARWPLQGHVPSEVVTDAWRRSYPRFLDELIPSRGTRRAVRKQPVEADHSPLKHRCDLCGSPAHPIKP